MKKLFKKYKYKIIFIIAAAILISVIFALFSVDSTTNSQNIEFINSFGWEVDTAPEDISHLTIPEELIGIYLAHAQISAIDGSSISDYTGKSLTRYSYKVLNHEDSDTGKIRADIFVYKSSIIAADISDISANGSTIPISDTDKLIP